MVDPSRVLAVCDMLAQPAASLDESAVVAAAAEHLARLVFSDQALVVVEGPAGAVVGAYPRPAELRGAARLLERVAAAPVGHVLQGDELRDIFRAEAGAAGFTAADRYRGAVAAIAPIEGRFEALDEWLLLVAARRTATQLDLVALHRDRLADAQIVEDARLAGELQRTMLPVAAPRSAAVDIAGRLRPARLVAGDLYDWVETDEATVAAVADVSGKGASAALLMAQLHASVRHHVAGCGPEPGAVLEEVSREIEPVLDRTRRLVTMAVAAVDPVSGTVRIASAGHSPVVLVRSGTAQLIDPGAPPLGVGAFPVTETTAKVGDGDALVLATDGLTDQRNAMRASYGVPRLLELITRSTAPSAARLADAMLDDVAAFAGGAPQDDDQTAVVVRLGGAAE